MICLCHSVSRLLKSNVFYFSVVLQLFSVFGFFISLFVVVMARQQMRVRFCTRKVPGRWSLHSFFDDCSHFQKKGTYTGFTNDNKTITKTITFGIKNGPCETRSFFLFLCLSSPFPLRFPFPSFSFSFSLPFSFPFSFLFPFPPFHFPSLFLSFSFPFSFSFLFLSLSFSSPFPMLSFPLLYSSFSFFLSSLMWILWSRCEASAWKNDKRKKTITCEKTSWKGSGFLQDPICFWSNCSVT